MWDLLKFWLDYNYFVIDIPALIAWILNWSVIGYFISVDCKLLLKMAKNKPKVVYLIRILWLS